MHSGLGVPYQLRQPLTDIPTGQLDLDVPYVSLLHSGDPRWYQVGMNTNRHTYHKKRQRETEGDI